MNNKYQAEINNFKRRFADKKGKRIVLYGIGRYTATLVDGANDFQFVGLMDKDPNSIGKVMFGLPIVNLATAEKIADLIVINTSETYWRVIYSRIQDAGIPVYYLDGRIAKKESERARKYPYGELSEEGLIHAIASVQAVSFDFFDTLFVRKVINPRDVFALLETEFANEWRSAITYTQARQKAITLVGENYTLDALYEKLADISGTSRELLSRIKLRELALERELLLPRHEVLSACKYAIKSGKQIYIVSDMYLPSIFYEEVLQEYGIEIGLDHIIVSCEAGYGKADGSIWPQFLWGDSGKKDSVIVNRKGRYAHIGDDQDADVRLPRSYGIHTYHTPSPWDMFIASSVGDIAGQIKSSYATAVFGCVMANLFNNPFSLGKTEGTAEIRNIKQMGYCVFGPVILTFLLWLLEHKKGDGINRLIFMSRDGYFLKDDIDLLCGCLGIKCKSIYIAISRQLAMTAAVENEKDAIAFLSMPYSGSVDEMLEDRLGIDRADIDKSDGMEDIYYKNKSAIDGSIRKTKDAYKEYIKGFHIDDSDAIVDLGYYGNNQRYLCQITGKNLKGYYFNANLSCENGNADAQIMRVCFQDDNDIDGKKSEILKQMIFLESFLTAPHGMVKGVTADGEMICAPDGGNQKYFAAKKEINEGVRDFIKEFADTFGRYHLAPDTKFVDTYYGKCFDGSVDYSDEIKQSFYNDNAMMNRIESQLFY